MNPALSWSNYLLKRQVFALTGKLRFYNPHNELVLYVEQKMFRRKGLKSMFRDEWEVLDAADQPIGMLFEDSVGQALLRRFLLGSLLPQNYDITIGDQRVADLRQKFALFGYQMLLDFSMDSGKKLDRRLGIAAGTLLAIIEGKQRS
ncbi:MAG: hypothetical protein QMD04_08610 [Anaerolineales bacterium]|nr:hypothetical protein [Anaerolineales bacterium]